MENKEVEVLETQEEIKVKPKKKIGKILLLILWFLITLALAGGLIYLVFIKKNYEVIEVTFDSSGGTEVDKQLVVKGQKITEPKVPVSEGYNFGGWYLGEEKFDFDTIVNKDVTLKAKWKIMEYGDSFYIQCYTRDSVEGVGNYEMVENPKVGDEMVCYFGFETRAVDPVAELSFELNYGEGLELLDVESTDDLKDVNGKGFSYEFEEPMPVNEAGAYIFKIIDDEDVDIRFGNISFVTEEGIVYKSKNIRISYEMEKEAEEYRMDAFVLQCYTKASVDENVRFQSVEKVKKGDQMVCFVGYETYAEDAIGSLSYTFEYGSGLKLLETNLPDGIIEDNVHSFEYEPTPVGDIAEYTFEVTDDTNLDNLYISLKDIRFKTKKKENYTNVDNTINFQIN